MRRFEIYLEFYNNTQHVLGNFTGLGMKIDDEIDLRRSLTEQNCCPVLKACSYSKSKYPSPLAYFEERAVARTIQKALQSIQPKPRSQYNTMSHVVNSSPSREISYVALFRSHVH